MKVYILISSGEVPEVYAVCRTREGLIKHTLGLDDYLDDLFVQDGPRNIPAAEAITRWDSSELDLRSYESHDIVYRLLEKEVE